MAVTGVVAGKLTPAPVKQTLASAYLDFANGTNDWAQQYLPDLMEKEAEVFGNRTISGFLSQVGAEESMTSDQVIWSEQGRLHLSYTNVNAADVGTGGTLTFNAAAKDPDGNVVAATAHGIRPGDMLLLSDANATVRVFVQSVDAAGLVTYERYDGHDTGDQDITGTDNVTVLVYGSEYVKGSVGRVGANKPTHKSRSNKPIIIKDKYEVSGSDASAIGWVEISGEEGQNGYLWYLKASGDTKARFSDYLEMAMLESVTVTSSAAAPAGNTVMGHSTVTNATGAILGTEGLWEALEDRGNISTAFDGDVTAALALTEMDDIIIELDKQGAIEENMMFLDRGAALNIDDMLAGMNSAAAGNTSTSWGVFNNSEDMALNLGFSGFRRGSYDFYKSDFKYLNDHATRGLINDTDLVGAIHGVLIPAGVSSVYDQSLGKNLKRPFLHVRYRASNLESRKYKTWTTGSVGATTSDLDAMEMHFLSERCLVVQGANNFVLLKGAAGSSNP
jgi:hypothetical protein